MNFGERLKLAMQITGVKPSALCKLTGLSQANLSHFVTGQREPSLPSLVLLLNAMPKVDARWLVTGESK